MRRTGHSFDEFCVLYLPHGCITESPRLGTSGAPARLCLKTMCSACDRVFAARGGPFSPPVGPLQADREAHRGLAHPSISAANPFLRQSLGSAGLQENLVGRQIVEK